MARNGARYQKTNLFIRSMIEAHLEAFKIFSSLPVYRETNHGFKSADLIKLHFANRSSLGLNYLRISFRQGTDLNIEGVTVNLSEKK